MGRYGNTHHTKLTWTINLLSLGRFPMYRIIDLENQFVRYPQRGYRTLRQCFRQQKARHVTKNYQPAMRRRPNFKMIWYPRHSAHFPPFILILQPSFSTSFMSSPKGFTVSSRVTPAFRMCKPDLVEDVLFGTFRCIWRVIRGTWGDDGV